MPLRKIVIRIRNLSRKWLDELRLIRSIWVGTYPHDATYRFSYLERIVMCLLVAIRFLSLSNVKHVALETEKEARTQISELYVVAWFAVLVALLFYPPSSVIPYLSFLIAYRLIEGFGYRFCIIFVDRYNSDWSLRSLNGSVILLLINYFEMIVGFAALYRQEGSIHLENVVVSDPWNALYFSAVSITTLGDVRFTPVSLMAKNLVSIEAVMGVVFLVVVVSTFVSGIPRIAGRSHKTGITSRSTGRAKSARR